LNVSLNLLSSVVFFLIANGIFATVILGLKRENRSANKYLCTLVFLLSLWLCHTFFQVSSLYGQNPDLYFLPIYFSLGFGPLIYLYTRRLTGHRFQFSYRQAFHFIPVLIQFVFYLFLQSKNYAFRREFWFEIHRPYSYDIELALSFLSLLIYLALSRKLIKEYKERVENSFSETEQVALQWLNQLHVVLFILSFIWFNETLGRLVWNFYPETPFSALTIGFVILFIAIGAIVQKDLTFTRNHIDDLNPYPAVPNELNAISRQEIERIESVLIQKELFLIPDITLRDFSEHVGLSPRETSYLINKGLNMSFIDFINRYRINRFKELATNKEYGHLSLLGIAYESGFNSKSTFNRVFRKMEGKSPSAFLKGS